MWNTRPSELQQQKRLHRNFTSTLLCLNPEEENTTFAQRPPAKTSHMALLYCKGNGKAGQINEILCEYYFYCHTFLMRIHMGKRKTLLLVDSKREATTFMRLKVSS